MTKSYKISPKSKKLESTDNVNVTKDCNKLIIGIKVIQNDLIQHYSIFTEIRKKSIFLKR